MRTRIAAAIAGLIVLAAVAVGVTAIASRTSSGPSGPDATLNRLVAAIAQGPEGDVAGAVRSGGEQLAAAVAAFDAGLPSPRWSATRGPTTRAEDNRAQTTMTVTITAGDLGEVTWDSTIEATRVYGEWGIDATPATLHPSMRSGDVVTVDARDVTRAPILDRAADPLTSHGNGKTVGIAPGRVINDQRLQSTWTSVLPESLGDLQKLLARTDLRPEWFYPVVTISGQRYESIRTRLRSVPGVIVRDADATTAADSGVATHVLGRVGRPTAEQMADLGVATDDPVGLRGLERVFEDQLVGSAQVRVMIRQPDGDEVAELAQFQTDPSSPVATTLDATVQRAVENSLTGVTTPAAVVVVDTADSAIRAVASRPLSGYNRAFEGNYPPGDALLPVTAEALLAGDVALRDDVTCPATATVAGAGLTAPRALGATTVGAALAAGCDTTLGALASGLSPDRLAASAQRFGYGVTFDLPLDAATPQFPTPRDTTETVRAAVGGAQVLSSPLHLATIAAAAESGQWHAPYLLTDDADGQPGSALSATALEDLQSLLDAGTQPGGSGAAFAAMGARGFVGTAAVTGGTAEHAWAIGVVDNLAFSVLVEDTGGDPSPAQAIAERFLRERAALAG